MQNTDHIVIRAVVTLYLEGMIWGQSGSGFHANTRIVKRVRALREAAVSVTVQT